MLSGTSITVASTVPGLPMGLLMPEPWTAEALCQETEPELFFPERGGSTQAAKAVCEACDVREECLAYALSRRERFGIWGGLSERERRRLTRGDAA
jgi:WhiB family transcriptional regulator, redox-sensing transcriptional regulator